MDRRHLSDYMTGLAFEVINSRQELQFIKESSAQIAFLESEHKKRRGKAKVLGQCEKVPEKMKWAVPFDFTITIFAPNCTGLTEEQLKLVLLHELYHVGIEGTEDGEERYFVVPHDLEDFRKMIDEFGAGWDAEATS